MVKAIAVSVFFLAFSIPIVASANCLTSVDNVLVMKNGDVHIAGDNFYRDDRKWSSRICTVSDPGCDGMLSTVLAALLSGKKVNVSVSGDCMNLGAEPHVTYVNLVRQ